MKWRSELFLHAIAHAHPRWRRNCDFFLFRISPPRVTVICTCNKQIGGRRRAAPQNVMDSFPGDLLHQQ